MSNIAMNFSKCIYPMIEEYKYHPLLVICIKEANLKPSKRNWLVSFECVRGPR